MNKYITILLLAFSGSAFSDSFSCIGERGAGVVFGEGIDITSQAYDAVSGDPGFGFFNHFEYGTFTLQFYRAKNNDIAQGIEAIFLAGKCSRI